LPFPTVSFFSLRFRVARIDASLYPCPMLHEFVEKSGFAGRSKFT